MTSQKRYEGDLTEEIGEKALSLKGLKLKRFSHQFNSKNNGQALLFKTILKH